MRQLPSAKVCFLGGCPQSGRNQNLYRRIAKQKTAVPQGAASLSLAVLESDGRKRGVAIDSAVNWGVEREGKTTLSNVGSDPQPAMNGQGGLFVA